MIGIFSLILSIAILIYFSFRGASILILTPLLAAALVLLTGDMPVLYAITGPFMHVTATYIANYFPIFLGGAIFGKIMGDTGAATAISHVISQKLGKERAVLAVVLATSILTYGGISLFVVVFAVYPLAKSLFKDAGISFSFIPASIALGAFTFTMTALPGSPQYLNSMPTNYLGTDIYAGPILGIIAAVIMLVLGVLWIQRSTNKYKNEGDLTNADVEEVDTTNLPSAFISIIPILIIFVANYILVNVIFKMPSFIERMKDFGGVNGNWPVMVALFLAIITSLFLFRKQLPSIQDVLARGAKSSLEPIFNTAVIVGFGGVIKDTIAFEVIKNFIFNLNISGLYKVALSTSILSAITGSSSGGTGIALESLSKAFLSMGIDPEAIHRIMLISGGGLDSLPHCGAVVTLLAVCGITHKQGYRDIGVVTVVIPVFATIVCIELYNLFGIV